MTNQEKFKVLADQIKISNQLDSEIIEQGELTRIDVSSKKQNMGISYYIAAFLSHEDYLLFNHAIVEEFKEIATVKCYFTVKILIIKMNMLSNILGIVLTKQHCHLKLKVS